MSRLTTVVCALSAIVTIVDYFTARAFFSGWLARQASHGPEGWRISASLNVLLIAIGAGLVWLVTGPDTPPADTQARQRLFRLRANLIACGLAVWFFLGPTIGGVSQSPPQGADTPAAPLGAATSSRPALRLNSASDGDWPGRTAPARDANDTAGGTPWPPRATKQSSEPWRPGDGIKSLGKLIDGWVAPHETPPPRLGE